MSRGTRVWEYRRQVNQDQGKKDNSGNVGFSYDRGQSGQSSHGTWGLGGRSARV